VPNQVPWLSEMLTIDDPKSWAEPLKMDCRPRQRLSMAGM